MLILTILLLVITILFVICAYLSQWIKSELLTRFGISLIVAFCIDLLLIFELLIDKLF